MENSPTQNEYSGMTVNERLFHAGLINDFDKSIEQQNRVKLIHILEKVFLSQENIDVVVKKYIKD